MLTIPGEFIGTKQDYKPQGLPTLHFKHIVPGLFKHVTYHISDSGTITQPFEDPLKPTNDDDWGPDMKHLLEKVKDIPARDSLHNIVQIV